MCVHDIHVMSMFDISGTHAYHTKLKKHEKTRILVHVCTNEMSPKKTQNTKLYTCLGKCHQQKTEFQTSLHHISLICNGLLAVDHM